MNVQIKRCYENTFAKKYIGTWVLWRDSYKFWNIAGKAGFADQFKTNITRYKNIGYNMDILR